MLLINPPCELESSVPSAEGQVTFEEYQGAYEQAVLDQPFITLNRVLRFLTRGHRGAPMSSAALESIIFREWRDNDVEASQKVARLVILGAFARSLDDMGIRMSARASRMLAACDEKIPRYLQLALDDHWVTVQVER
jgi:hypothetical protein